MPDPFKSPIEQALENRDVLQIDPAAKSFHPGGPVVPSRLFHVVAEKADLSRGLKSLFRQFGSKAYDMFAKRWPEAANLGEYHAHNTHFYDNLEAAQFHADQYGGKILEINPQKVDELKFDTLERPGFWTTTSDVPPDAIMRVVK
jgi:hypothetical protein